MNEVAYDDPGTPLFWELMAKYGPAFLNSPWAPEFLEVPAEPSEEAQKVAHWPVTFEGALEYTRRLVGAQQITQALPLLALDQYAQEVDLDDAKVQEIIDGVLVDD